MAGRGVNKPGQGERGAASQVRALCPVLPSVPFGYKPGRNAASEGVSFVDRRQEEQAVPSVSHLPLPAWPWPSPHPSNYSLTTAQEVLCKW